MVVETMEKESVGVYALSRTGHNAIITWIKANWQGDVRVINFEDGDMKPRNVDHHVLVMRDPYNWLASWITGMKKWASKQQIETAMPKRIELWKKHALEVLGETECFPGCHFILYNSWCWDPVYRRRIARELGMGIEDKTADRVSPAGGGSSWDRLKFDGRAHEMDTRNRWKLMENDKEYRRLIQDEELIAFTKRMFNIDPPMF